MSSPFAFTLQAPPQPTIAQLGLLCDTGSSQSDNVTANDTLSGTLSNYGNFSDASVEFSINGTGSYLDRATPTADGSFSFEPIGLAYGSYTVVATPTWWDPTQSGYVNGPTTSFAFTYQYQAAAAPIIADLGLLNVVGTSAFGPETIDGTVQGRIIAQGTLAGASIDLQFYNGAGTFEFAAQTTTDSLGNFTYTATGLAPGIYQVEARASIFDEAGQQSLQGDWSSFFTFTVIADAAPAVSSLTLANNLATGGADAHGTDPTVQGQISGLGLLGDVTIQFEQGDDQNGNGSVTDSELVGTTQGAIDGTSDTTFVPTIVGTTTTDASGNFTYTPEDLPAGKLALVKRGR